MPRARGSRLAVLAAAASCVLTAVAPQTAAVGQEPAAQTRAQSVPAPPPILAFGDAAPFPGAPPDRAVVAAANRAGDGLFVATGDGSVTAFGAAVHAGAITWPLRDPVVALAPTPSGRGYWLVARDGGVFSFGDAAFLGSTGSIRLNEPVVAAAATPSGRGYWLIARDGGVFAFGDAAFLGSTGSIRLNQPVVAAAATPSGRGYWLFARDGGVFSFGDATFAGSTGGIRLNQPIVGAAGSPGGRGYWLMARDGGVFAFGDALFHGAGVGRLAAGRSAVALAPSRRGYWMVQGAGSVRIAIAGDVHGERHLGDQARARQPLLAGVAPVLAAADIAAVNLETPSGSPGTPQTKAFLFLAPPEVLTALATGGVDVVTMANNHALDHGPASMLDTRDRARAAGLVTVGAGRNADEAFAPAFVDAAGRRAAFVGLSLVVPPGWAATATTPGVASAYDQARALDAVRQAAAGAATVVVLIHWGVELARCPGPALERFADALHDAGADVVAGHHPHVLQGVDARPDRVTAYSLGNFVWYHSSPPSDTTGILDVTANDSGLTTTFHPARIGANGTPSLLDKPQADGVQRATLGGSCWRRVTPNPFWST